MPTPRTIHDFGRSLPSPLFDCQYPAPGSPELAMRVAKLLSPTSVGLDQSWGLDHGTWSVLSKVWPAANIPTVQLSMDTGLSDQQHYDLARRLLPLRDEGVLIIGSGNIVHNLGVMEWGDDAIPYDWAVRFKEYMNACIAENDMQRLYAYSELGNDAQLAVPGPDHFWPLLYALGVRDGDPVEFVTDFIVYKSLSMTSLVIGNSPV